MHIEVDNMIIALTVFRRDVVQVVHQASIRSGAQDVDLDRYTRLAQRLDQGTRDGTIAHVAFAMRACGHDQQVDGGGRAYL